MSKVAVFGSFVVDLMARSPHLPVPGETVKGSVFKMGPGGKWQDSLWRIPMGRMYERPYFTKKGHRRRLRKEKKDAIR